jgi:ribosomal-protein-alanine N-acetyltransferase
MAVLQLIRDFFLATETAEDEAVQPAPLCEYRIRPLTEEHLTELIAANVRCFRKGENYTRHTFTYLLNEPSTLSYRVESPDNPVVAFIFIMTANGTGHITTIGVTPEHRRRGLAAKLIVHTEVALAKRGFLTTSLEVRVSNTAAQALYFRLGYTVVQRLEKYYNNGEDGFLMVKGLF